MKAEFLSKNRMIIRVKIIPFFIHSVTGEKLMDKQLLAMIHQNLYWTEKILLNLMCVVKFVGTHVGTSDYKSGLVQFLTLN